MREIRQSGSEGGEPHPNAASLPLSCGVRRFEKQWRWAIVLPLLRVDSPPGWVNPIPASVRLPYRELAESQPGCPTTCRWCTLAARLSIAKAKACLGFRTCKSCGAFAKVDQGATIVGSRSDVSAWIRWFDRMIWTRRLDRLESSHPIG
jgi:hypothetical protein